MQPVLSQCIFTMGVDITHIIRHDFRFTQDIPRSLEFARRTVDRLKKALHIPNPDTDFELSFDEELKEITFYLPIYEVEFSLHSGFWQVESFYHYSQLVRHQGDYFRLRALTYDLTCALGKEEAWYTTEYYTWNGGKCDTLESTFEAWNEQASKAYGKPITEFSLSAFNLQMDNYPDYEPIYHDSFLDCRDSFNRLQADLLGYRLLGIYRIGKYFVRCEKDGQLFLLNTQTHLPLFTEAIDAVLSPLNGPEFVVVKNGLSAVFSAVGGQLTDFVNGRFEWKWAPVNPSRGFRHERIIFNKEANISVNIDECPMAE